MDRIATTPRRGFRRDGMTHLVALERRGMTGLAEYLVSEEERVSGSVDGRGRPDDRLVRMGVRVHRGHAPSAVPHLADRLVYPPGIARSHPERLVALKRGVRQLPLALAVGEAIRGTDPVTVVGRRVARVASTMIGWILNHAGLDPTLLLEAEIPGRVARGRSGTGPFSVVDVPEELIGAGGLPSGGRILLLLDVGELGPDARSGLAELADSMCPGALMLGFAGDHRFDALASGTSARVGRLSFDPERSQDWWGADLKADRGRYRFRVFHEGDFVLELSLSCPGRRYVVGALAAIAACRSLELGVPVIREALMDYLGASRAFDHRGTYRGVTLIDDDAVDPSDVAETLELARMVYGRRRLWAVYSPSGTDAPPVSCLAPADRVLWLGRPGNPESDLHDRGGLSDDWLRHAADHEEALWNLDRHLEPGDVLVTLGSGETGTIADAFIRRLPRDRQGG